MLGIKNPVTGIKDPLMGSAVDWSSLRKDSEIRVQRLPKLNIKEKKDLKQSNSKISQTVNNNKRCNIHIKDIKKSTLCIYDEIFFSHNKKRKFCHLQQQEWNLRVLDWVKSDWERKILYHMISLTCGMWKIWTHRNRKKNAGYQGLGMGDTERDWRFGQRVQTYNCRIHSFWGSHCGFWDAKIVFYILEWASFLVAQTVRNLPAMWETWVQSLS